MHFHGHEVPVEALLLASHQRITPEHLLKALLDDEQGAAAGLIRGGYHFGRPAADAAAQADFAFETVRPQPGDLPIVLYNIPQRVVLHLSPADIDRLAGIDTVIAVKQAVTDLDEARQIVEAGKLALYAGNDDLVLPFALLGGSGGICVASHIVGAEMTAVQAAADAGDADEATRLDDALQSAYTALSCAVNPIPVKTAMELLGFKVGDLRLPLVNATDEERAVVRAELVARGLIG
jgi:dihydrodipicolinate synthase/N-acetylneuraminate lyase